MVNDTLLPVGFDRAFVKANVPSEDRHALGCLLGEQSEHGSEGDIVRMVISAGLTALDWPPERRIEMYAQYRVRCIQDGAPNEYGKE